LDAVSYPEDRSVLDLYKICWPSEALTCCLSQKEAETLP